MSGELYKPRALTLTDRWREMYNPLYHLGFRQIVAWLYEQQLGIVSNITWLYRFIERRDPILIALISRRSSALRRLDWNVKEIPENELPDGATKAMAEAQRIKLRNSYDKLKNLRAAVYFLALATFRGYTHLEKHYDANGDVIHLELVPQWNWARAGLTGDWFYNKGAYQIYARPEAPDPQLQAIDEKDFIIREVEYPIDEIAVIAHMRKAMSQKDWDAFIEVYGINPLFVELPENAPKDNAGNVEGSYQALAEKVASDSRGVLPSGAKIQTVDAGSRGKNPFLEHLRYQDEQIVLAGTGGLLTMLTQSGSGTLAGAAHKDTFDAIAEAEAFEISEIFQEQFDALILEKYFPGQPKLAYFELEAKELTDASKVVDDVLKLAQAGYEVDLDQLEEKSGYKLAVRPPVNKAVDRADAGNSGIQSEPVTENRLRRAWRWLLNRRSWLNRETTGKNMGKLVSSALDQLAPAQAESFKQLLHDFGRDVVEGDDAGMDERWKAFKNRLPGHLKKMNLRPATAEILENAFSSGYLGGLFAEAKKGQSK